jgi:hypothetical protein
MVKIDLLFANSVFCHAASWSLPAHVSSAFDKLRSFYDRHSLNLACDCALVTISSLPSQTESRCQIFSFAESQSRRRQREQTRHEAARDVRGRGCPRSAGLAQRHPRAHPHDTGPQRDLDPS